MLKIKTLILIIIFPMSQEAGKKDFITELNETAAYNITNKDFYGNDLKIFGDYDFIPVQESR